VFNFTKTLMKLQNSPKNAFAVFNSLLLILILLLIFLFVSSTFKSRSILEAVVPGTYANRRGPLSHFPFASIRVHSWLLFQPNETERKRTIFPGGMSSRLGAFVVPTRVIHAIRGPLSRPNECERNRTIFPRGLPLPGQEGLRDRLVFLPSFPPGFLRDPLRLLFEN